MKLVYFTQSVASCWNNGHAHFLRGILRELLARGHEAESWEPAESWTRSNLMAEHGEAPLQAFAADFSELHPRLYGPGFDLAQAVAGADVVIVHEWNEPDMAASLGRLRARGAPWRLLFHDTHHRSVSDPAAMRRYDLSGFDAVLAYGEAIAEVYRTEGWGSRVFVWHEAADTRLFRPPDAEGPRTGLVWIGNWGDDERTAELRDYLLRPAHNLRASLDVYGVRYPEPALAELRQFGARYHGWLPNSAAPKVFAGHLATVHVPRRWYAGVLPGIPTIRVFEALACGIPLISAPWEDSERLFRDGDFLMARSPIAMERNLQAVLNDAALRTALAKSGLETVRTRHTCAHRVDELLQIVARVRGKEAAG